MKMVKSLILGSAAGLIAMSGAQAADLPVKAKAVEYVRICSLYGAGFFYIPGTDTCIKLGGYLRVDTTFHGGVYDEPFYRGEGGAGDRYANQVNARSRMALTIDTRTATEYGVVRTFGQADFQMSTYGSTSAIGYAASVSPAATSGLLTPDQVGAGYVAVEMAFVQFAGFTFGKSASAYATPWHGYPGNNSSFLVGGHDSVTGVNNIQYTAQFGNGVSGTIGLDENSATNYNRTQIINAIGGAPALPNAAAPGGGNGVPGGTAGGNIGFSGACTAFITTVGCAYGGAYAPDVVGNIRVDQAWGLFQISAAAHQNRAGYFNFANIQTNAAWTLGTSQVGAENFGHPDAKWGGAVMGSLQIKNIPTGAGDDIKLDASYSKGATKYVLGYSGTAPSSYNMYNGRGYAMGVVSDAVYSGNSPAAFNCPALAAGPGLGCNGNTLTQLQLTEAWGFRGAFNHNWDPYWSTSLFGGIAQVRYNQTAKQLYCNTYVANAGIAVAGGGVTNGGGTGGIFAPGSVCDPGFTISEIGVVTRWTPVKNLTFSVEALYAMLKTNMSGAVNPVSAGTGGTSGPSSALPLANTVYNFANQGTASLNVRVQRNF